MAPITRIIALAATSAIAVDAFSGKKEEEETNDQSEMKNDMYFLHQ